jgi:hypothetical protein
MTPKVREIYSPKPMTNPSLARKHIAWCIATVHTIDRAALRQLTCLDGNALEQFIAHEICAYCMDNSRIYYRYEERYRRDGRQRVRTTL